MRHKWLIASLALNALLILGAVVAVFTLSRLVTGAQATQAERWRSQFDLPSTRHGIVFLGDSITEGGHWNELLQNPEAINRGIGGNTTADVLARLQQIYPLQPRQLFLMIGINDLNRGVPVAETLENYRRLFDGLATHLPHTQVLVQSVLPVNDDWFFDVDGADILRINRFLKEEAGRRGHVFVDLYPAFSDERGQLLRTLSNDGIHLLGAGYALWRDRIAALLVTRQDDLTPSELDAGAPAPPAAPAPAAG